MKRALAAAALLAAALAAHAGRPCEEAPLTTRQVERGMNLAQATAQALDASGADVVILARAGQDLSQYGLQWSHLGFAYKDGANWRVLHKLNHCGTDRAELYRQGLGEFFLDRPHRYEAAYAALAPAVQQALLPVLRDNARAAALHSSAYSMVAYPWSTRYQQSNQWALETLAGAMLAASPDARRGRGAAQDWLLARGFRPSDLRISTLTRLGARISRANIAFDDHPNDKRFSGHIETTTVDAVFAWLPRAGLGAAPQRIKETP